jgi:hypothetical protein
MLRNKTALVALIGFLILIIFFSFIPNSIDSSYETSGREEFPKTAGNLEGAENILITQINREAELNGYGLVHYEDEMTIKNMNDNPITSFFIGIPSAQSENLVFYKTKGENDNTLSSERNGLIMKEYEMISINFNSPVNPYQSRKVNIEQTYKDMMIYTKDSGSDQKINFTGYVYPILPYKSQGSIVAEYEYPDTSSVENLDWGEEDRSEDLVRFELSQSGESFLEPFLENLEEDKIVQILLSDEEITKLEFNELTREIFISPWGLIKVTEEYEITNEGAIDFDEIIFEIPGPAKEIKVYDDLGEILGVSVDPEENYYNLTYKDLIIDLSENRVDITPDSKFKFNLQYFLPFDKYFSSNWFQISIKMNLLTSKYEYLGQDQIIKVIIESCLNLEYVSEKPNSIEHTQNGLILVYESDYVSPLEEKDIQFTYLLNIFDMSFRPIIFFIIIAVISSGFVVLIKTRKEGVAYAEIGRELLPLNEIREFCSLYEEKNALQFEIRQAEEDVKRKKLIKKKYRNILEKNNKKIEEIQKELISLKKLLRETNATFENIISNVELLEAERQSVDDSLSLLEARYKRGRLPSKRAYLRLSDNFLRRRKKIDSSIDKYITQLRSYLL